MTKNLSLLIIASIVVQVLGFGVLILKSNGIAFGGTTNFNDLVVDSVSTGSSTASGVVTITGNATLSGSSNTIATTTFSGSLAANSSTTIKCLAVFPSSSIATAYYLMVDTGTTTKGSGNSLLLMATTTRPVTTCP